MRVSLYNRVKVSLPKRDPITKKILPDPKRVAKDFLESKKKYLPNFRPSTEREYNGYVIYIEEEDKDDFTDAFDVAGFEYDIDPDR